MQIVIYTLFSSASVLGYLKYYDLVNRYLALLPEILSVVILVAVITGVVRQKVIQVGVLYWIVFLMLALDILCGVILNAVSTGPLVAGLRNYLKCIPFFFLPAVFQFSNLDIKKQLGLLLAIALLQLPVSLYQRFVQFAGVLTGDVVMGTIGASGLLTIFQVCAAAMVLAFYLKKKISGVIFFSLFIALLLPATINETKITIFLVPVALLTPVLFLGKDTQRHLLSIIVLGVVFFSMFIPIYDYLMKPRWGYGIIDFFTMEGRLERYTGVGSDRVGRVDKLLLPFSELSEDPTKLIFGLGIGNTSRSFLGSQFDGEYFETYQDFLGVLFSELVWELGVLGTFLVFVLYFIIFRDALRVIRSDDIRGTIALGWVGVLPVLVLSTFYVVMIPSALISYSFWYFSGYIASAAYQMRMEEFASKGSQNAFKARKSGSSAETRSLEKVSHRGF